MSKDYHTVILTAEPRIFGLPLLTVLPLVVLVLIGLAFSNNVFNWMVAGFIASGAVHFTHGDKAFRVIVGIIYSHCPREVTQVLFRRWPDPAHRLFLK